VFSFGRHKNFSAKPNMSCSNTDDEQHKFSRAEILDKLVLLNTLRQFVANGQKLGKTFSVNDDYEDLAAAVEKCKKEEQRKSDLKMLHLAISMIPVIAPSIGRHVKRLGLLDQETLNLMVESVKSGADKFYKAASVASSE
jgi:hypothetical protein